MGKGSPGTGQPYMRGKIWWIEYRRRARQKLVTNR